MANAAKKIEKEETKAVALAPSATELAASEAASSTEIVASDVLIPRLLLAQGISPVVTSRKAQIGDMVRSTTFEKLGNPEQPLEIVPLKMTNTWINFERVAGAEQPQFRGQEHRGVTKDAHGTVVSTNEDLPWEYKGQNGEDMFRRKAITLYALVPADVQKYNEEVQRAIESGEAPDLNKTVLPIVITFQSTSFKHAGKKCASFFNSVRVNQAKLGSKMLIAPFQYILTLESKQETKGKASWYVYDFQSPKALKDAAVREEAARWTQLLNSITVKTDDAGEVDEGSSSNSSGAAEMEV